MQHSLFEPCALFAITVEVYFGAMQHSLFEPCAVVPMTVGVYVVICASIYLNLAFCML